jgi:hypothetical protein
MGEILSHWKFPLPFWKSVKLRQYSSEVRKDCFWFLQMIPPVNSLVKYDNPILVASTKGKKAADPKAAAPKVPPAATQTEDILNSILPPRYIVFVQYFTLPSSN